MIVPSLEGVFITNTYDEKYLDLIDIEMRFNSQQVGAIREKQLDLELLQHYRQTKISFDNGGRWYLLKAPRYDSQGKIIKCEDDCYLHLHIYSTENHSPVYSIDSGLGIIIGVGNIGSHLSTKMPTNTYMSRDGGVEWYEVAKGNHIYEIGDQGGFIVMANYMKKTNFVKYSWDEGKSWDKLYFSDDKTITIKNIVTEPSNQDTVFYVHGDWFDEENHKYNGVVVKLDFNNFHTRNCIYYDDPENKESDYEYWIPHSAKNSKCLMGHRSTYIRKQLASHCINPDVFTYIVSYANCKCTIEDWVCDKSFVRDEGGSCVRADGKEIDLNPPTNCYSSYKVNMGYRKGSGNTCVNGIEKVDLELKCPMTWKLNLLAKFCALVIILLILYTAYRFKRDHLPEINLLKGYTKTEIPKEKYENLDNSQEDITNDNIIFDDDYNLQECSPRHGRKTSYDSDSFNSF